MARIYVEIDTTNPAHLALLTEGTKIIVPTFGEVDALLEQLGASATLLPTPDDKLDISGYRAGIIMEAKAAREDAVKYIKSQAPGVLLDALKQLGLVDIKKPTIH